MHIRKRWLAFMLTTAIALSECGGMTVFATEDAVTGETTVSENTTVSDEISEDGNLTPEPETSEEDAENQKDEAGDISSDTSVHDAAPKEKLPALHIGQISKGDTLPSADDDAFHYDLPISFTSTKNLILFVNYTVEAMPETEETGELEWSILRGKKGLEAGSTTLLDEEDDWNGFETVSSSPYFSMEEMADTEDAYYRMLAPAPEEVFSTVDESENHASEETAENYDYYIRAAYYPQTKNEKAEDFYAAATIPFVPRNDTTADTDRITEDAADTEENPTGTASEDASVSENSTDANDRESSGDDLMEDDATTPEGSGTDSAPEGTESENAGEEQAAEPASTLSENSATADAVTLADGNELPPLEKEADGSLVLYKGVGTDDENIIDRKERITMSPGDTQQITAKAVPDMAQADFVWESSDEAVATVTKGENGSATITAAGEGFVTITASCHGITAFAVIDVVLDKTNPDNDKLLDLSGDIRVAGFEKESDKLVYSGQKITQNLRVYHKDTLLTEKTDYTLSYKNNINAAAWNSTKAPSVTINLKGQYQGSVTLYYTIKPLDINNIDIYNTPKVSPGYEQTVNYSKKLNIPAPVLTYGKKKLAVKKDFICDYTTPGENMTPLPADYKNGDLYEAGKVYSYTVNGTGNFTGSFPMQLVVLKDKTRNFSAASVKLDKKQYEYHGAPLSKSDVLIEEVKISGQVLDKTLYGYEVFAAGTDGAYVMLSPTEAGKTAGYCGCKKITLKLVGDRQLKDAVPGADWKESIPFSQKTVDKNGGIFQNGPALLAFGEERLTEGTDYTVKYSNAKKAGKVTATFTGKGRYKGALRLTYSITPNTDIKIFMGKNVTDNNGTYEVAYQKGGAVPELILKDQDYTVLKNKTDYTIKYKDNKTPGTPMTCEIKGKGNYKGYEKTVTLAVTKADIGQAVITVSDKPYDPKPNKWKSNVTVTDTNGKKLTAKTDYIKEVDYSYANMNPADPNAVPTVGTTVTAKVTGTGFYEGTLAGTYRIYDKAKDIGKLKIVIDPQTYTGAEIKLEKSDIHVYASDADKKANKELEGKDSCFEIVESTYKNNIKAGTAKVTLHGIGEYGGTKTYSFKIQKKKYLMNRVKGIVLDKTTHNIPLTAKEEERMLTATITPETSDQVLTNPTVIWTSSNNNIATVEPAKAGTGSNPQNTFISSAVIQAKKAGKVTITATTQDGNKKAKCTVTISVPVLKQANQTIEGKVGDTYQLTFVGYEDQKLDTDSIVFESDNPSIVSVDNKGLLSMNKMGAASIKVYTGGQENMQQCYVVVDGTVENPESDSKALVYKQAEGCTDDTPYINKMLRDWEWGDRSKYDYMYIPEGTYHIDATAGGEDIFGKYKFGGIVLTENQTLIMSPEAKLVAIGNNKSNYQIINVFGRSNVTISGGQIIGERDSHSGSNGEWGHGIAIFGSTNVYIKDVEVSKCFGDGIYLGFYDGPNKCSNGITIKNCNLHDNRRNNLSITDVSNVTVRNCKFNNANGKAPQYGIDIEPNRNKTCSNVTISDSTFHGNAGGTIQILGQLNAHVKGVTIENCTGDKKPDIWQGYGGSVSGVKENGNKW